MQSNTIEIGNTGKTHGLKGEINLILKSRVNVDWKKTKYVMALINDVPTPFFVEKITQKGKNALIKFDGINNIEGVQKLVNKSILVNTEFLKVPKENEKSIFDVIGFNLQNPENEVLGQIVEIMELPNNFLYVLKTNAGKEALLPINDDLVKKIDYKAQIITYSVPEGLLE